MTIPSKRVGAIALTILFLQAIPAPAQDSPHYAGPTKQGYLLPNSRTISPAGVQVALADLPLNIIPSRDARARRGLVDGAHRGPAR